jgi:hypothetical protein
MASSSPAAAQNRFARREHAAHRPPLVAREGAVRRQEVVARSAATIREAHFSRLSARMQRVACAAYVEMSTRRVYAVLPEMSTAMGSVVGVLVRMVYACRRWRVARPKDLLATARPNRLALILAGLNVLWGVATRRPNRAYYPRVSILGIHQTSTLLGHTCATYTDSTHYYLRSPKSTWLSMVFFSHTQCIRTAHHLFNNLFQLTVQFVMLFEHRRVSLSYALFLITRYPPFLYFEELNILFF